MIRYLSVEQILSLHQSLVGHLSEVGVRDLRSLEYSASRPAASFEGEDVYPSLETKAAVLVQGLVSGAAFYDRGRETAWVAAECFLLANGASLLASDRDVDQILTAMTAGEIGVEGLAVWIRQRLAGPRTRS